MKIDYAMLGAPLGADLLKVVWGLGAAQRRTADRDHDRDPVKPERARGNYAMFHGEQRQLTPERLIPQVVTDTVEKERRSTENVASGKKFYRLRR